MQRLLLILSVIALSLTACQKEGSVELPGNAPGNNNGGNGGGGGGTSNGNEVGTWKVIALDLKSNSEASINASGVIMKTITTTDYAGKNVKGTVKFDGKTMTGTDIAYSIDTKMAVKLYIGGQLMDEDEMPFAMDIPASSSSADYKKIGSDSLYFAAGSSMTVGDQGTVSGDAIGYKLLWDGDKLKMTGNISQTKTETVQGQTATVVQKGTTVITLQKQ